MERAGRLHVRWVAIRWVEPATETNRSPRVPSRCSLAQANPVGTEVAWTWIQRRWVHLMAMMGPGPTLTACVLAVMRRLPGDNRQKDVLKFAKVAESRVVDWRKERGERAGAFESANAHAQLNAMWAEAVQLLRQRQEWRKAHLKGTCATLATFASGIKETPAAR